MFEWIDRLVRRNPQHEPGLRKSQRDQRRRFAAWSAAMAEVRRVEAIAERRHSDLHKTGGRNA